MHAPTLLLGTALVVLLAPAQATEVRTCSTDAVFKDAQVEISNCTRPPCRLKKKTKVSVEFKFTPDHNITKLENSVSAYIVGVPFPFVGVDGTDACPNIFKPDGTTKAGCPLAANEEYIYKNAFDVLEIYPRIKVNVQWALMEPTTFKNAHCFQVQSKIVA